MDRIHAMQAFVAVADLQGFAPAARKLRLSPSAVTRLVAALEDRLGVRLLQRSTRAVQLTSAGFAVTLEELRRASGLEPGRIDLEVTESTVVDDRAHRVLEDLRSAGYGIVIDDFGTGYSSFATLSELPVDTLKIDKRFVDKVLVDLGSVVKIGDPGGKLYSIADNIPNLAGQRVAYLESQLRALKAGTRKAPSMRLTPLHARPCRTCTMPLPGATN